MRKLILPLLGIFLLFTTSITAQEHQHHHMNHRHELGYAPVSVMGDHLHHKRGVMFSYRYMPMWMEGNLSEKSKISNKTILQSFMVAPQNMNMTMHMLSAMYAVSDHMRLMAMGNYLSKSMDLETRMGHQFTTHSGGLGDVSISALIKILNKNRQSLHINAGLSIPTGNIDQRDATPMSENAPLAYPMQLGSGTWDPMLGATYLGQSNIVSWGLQSKFKWRLGENSEIIA